MSALRLAGVLVNGARDQGSDLDFLWRDLRMVVAPGLNNLDSRLSN